MNLYEDCLNYKPGVKKWPCPRGYLFYIDSYREKSSTVFFSEITGPIKTKFHMVPQKLRGMKVCSPHLGHMIQMASTPIYGKNPLKIFFSGTWGLVCSIGDMGPIKFEKIMILVDLDLFNGKIKFFLHSLL